MGDGNRQTGRTVVWVLLGVVVMVAAFVAWRWYSHGPGNASSLAQPAAAASTAQDDTSRQAAQYPVSAISTVTPQPGTAASVATASSVAPRTGLLALAGSESLSGLLVSEALIPHIVATVDALPHRKLSGKVLPLSPPTGDFVVEHNDRGTVTSAANQRRYKPYLELLEKLDLDAAVQWYVAHYPSFQQAYRKLGHPDGHFNDRLVAVIDHLLTTPKPRQQPLLTRHKGHWEYASSALQSRSAGQRILLRLPTEQRQLLDQRLQRLRALLAAGNPAVAGTSASP